MCVHMDEHTHLSGILRYETKPLQDFFPGGVFVVSGQRIERIEPMDKKEFPLSHVSGGYPYPPPLRSWGMLSSPKLEVKHLICPFGSMGSQMDHGMLDLRLKNVKLYHKRWLNL